MIRNSTKSSSQSGVCTCAPNLNCLMIDMHITIKAYPSTFHKVMMNIQHELHSRQKIADAIVL